jgi:hypothetical protein
VVAVSLEYVLDCYACFAFELSNKVPSLRKSLHDPTEESHMRRYIFHSVKPKT